MQQSGIKLSDIDNPYTLNIFTDASIFNKRNGYDGCYGAIAVFNDTKIDEIYRINTDTTNNNAEIKGVRAGVYLALKYQHQFRIINIFSDSQISIFGIRDRLINWRYDFTTQSLIGNMDQQICNQEIFMEIVYLMLQNNLRINFLHQKGHVNDNIRDTFNARHVFASSNYIRGKVDLNLIKFISKWNAIVDFESRNKLYQRDKNRVYNDAVDFSYAPFDRIRFQALSQNTIKKGELT